MAGNIRAVVVDDSQFMRTMICDMLEEAGITVVAEGKNGRDGVQKVLDHDPDVVTMDVEMPQMDGLEAVEEIMDQDPTPILMLSAHTGDGSDTALEALDRGAVDVFAKPGGEVSTGMTREGDTLVAKVTEVAQADVSTTRSRSSSGSQSASTTLPHQTAGGAAQQTASGTTTATPALPEDAIVAIGSSTGGPQVVENVLEDLSAASSLRVLIVQHMPDGFTGRLASRLDDRSAFDVSEASNRQRVGPGEAVVAPGDKHLLAHRWRSGKVKLRLNEDPPLHGCRPAVDHMMRSVADIAPGPLAGVILTGMGEDGTTGLRAIDAAGGYTVAQDETTSAVHGMPGSAIAAGVVDDVRPDTEIADAVINHLQTTH